MHQRPIAATLLVLALAGCNKQPQATAAQKSSAQKAASAVGTRDDLLQALGKTGDLSTMAGYVRSAGLENTFKGIGNYTLFAPTDEAFKQFPEDQRKLMTGKEGRPRLLALLRQHIATGYIAEADLTRAMARNAGAASVATMGGAPIRVHRSGNVVMLGTGDTGPRVLAEPVTARNGVIYRIDKVIAPDAVAEARQDSPDLTRTASGSARSRQDR